MRTSLERIPSYLCLQTIDRVRLNKRAARRREKQQKAASGRAGTEVNVPLESTDTLRIESAYVDGKELYSWPGAETFEEQPLAEMVGFGNLSTGLLASTAHNLFLTTAALFEFVGREDLDGRPVLRYDFQVSLLQSGFVLADSSGAEAEVPYAGSIWAEPQTFNLIRIEMWAEGIPEYLKISSSVTRIDYQAVTLDGSSFLLPKTAHEVTRLRAGGEHHKRTEFADCPRFGASSELSFGAETTPRDEDRRAGLEGLEDVALPAGLPLALRLTSEIGSEESRVGDAIEGVLESDAVHNGRVAVPNGAAVIGRIRRLERYAEPAAHHLLGLEISEVRFEGKRARFRAEMERVLPVPGIVFAGPEGIARSRYDILSSGQVPGRIKRDTSETYNDIRLPGVGVIPVQGKRFRIPAGLRMTWRTVAPN